MTERSPTPQRSGASPRPGNRRWWHRHVLRGEELLGAQRHSHAHLDWWHGDGDHGLGEEPEPLRRNSFSEPSSKQLNESRIEQFMTVSSPYLANQPSRPARRVVEL
jgi:hypothetical protein